MRNCRFLWVLLYKEERDWAEAGEGKRLLFFFFFNLEELSACLYADEEHT